ncbi:hypothetical protein [Leuconostoc citreum]|uniref:hypothetical protein n=1 Tax=Leuconostoc citreum TaxID=33964 RepID=UPI0020A0F522|nr:hypothetical protein [Leuconostoc citreum]MCP1275773.1 hypothetical protein [Leuconostoc citreum]
MKIRYIILFFITASLAIGGVLVYIGHDNSNTTLDSEKTSKASDASSTKQPLNQAQLTRQSLPVVQIIKLRQ